MEGVKMSVRDQLNKQIRITAPTREFAKNSLSGIKTSVFISEPKVLKDGLFSGSYVTFQVDTSP
jgi:hypothetical protein